MPESYLNAALGKVQSFPNTRDSVASVHSPSKVEVDTNGVPIAKRQREITITPTVSTSPYDVGDIFFDTASIADAVAEANVSGIILGARLMVKSDVAFGCRIIFMAGNVSLGTINLAPSISDANGENQRHHFELNQSSQVDMGAYRMMNAHGLWVPVYPASGGTTLWLAGTITEGTPTMAASSCILTLDIL